MSEYVVKSRHYVRTGRKPARVPFVEIIARCLTLEMATDVAARYAADLGCDEDAVWVEGPTTAPTKGSDA